MTKRLVIILTCIATLLATIYISNNFEHLQHTFSNLGKQNQSSQPVTPGRATLSGQYVCLPHADQNGPQTPECIFGIKTDNNEYYAVDFNLSSQTAPDLKTGDRIKASGVITPIEALSSDHWRKYKVKGIFSITDSVEILEK